MLTTRLEREQLAVTGLFGSVQQAEAAIAELRRLGLDGDDIVVVARANRLYDLTREVMERHGTRCYVDLSSVPCATEPGLTVDDALGAVVPGD